MAQSRTLAAARVFSSSKPIHLIRLLRVNQWTKNVFCLAGLFFSAKYVSPSYYAPAVLTFCAFALASSCIYVINDIVDIDLDRHHPKKRFRPLAAGEFSCGAAGTIAVAVGASGVLLATTLGSRTLGCLIVYIVLTLAYTFGLKNVPLVDVFCISAGFMLRLLAGIYAVNEIPTGWITICAMFLTLFIGFAKRRGELVGLAQMSQSERAFEQRPVLDAYDGHFLDSVLSSTATMSILTYALFTMSSGKPKSLLLTTPVVVYAILRWKQLVLVDGLGDEPERLVFSDTGLKVSMLLWVGLYCLLTHVPLDIFG